MGMTADNYLQALLQLLPPGKAYSRSLHGYLAATLKAIADEFARVDARVGDLIEEADPRTTVEMIDDWERLLDLPDDSTGMLDTLADRRLAAVAKLTAVGGQSRAYFIQLAAAMGYAITITEFKPYTCMTAIDEGVYQDEVRLVWQVNAPETTIRAATCQSPCSDPLRSWGNELLESAITSRKPAHTTVIYSYGG